MPFNAKKLRVVMPDRDDRAVLPVAMDFGAADVDTLDCFAAAHQQVTHGYCWSHSCIDEFSEPQLLYAAPVEILPLLREALEAQLAEVDRAEEVLSKRQADQ